MSQLKIVVTGGHSTPAAAFVKALIESNVDFCGWWLGRTTTDSHGSKAQERKLATSLGLNFISVNPGKLYRKPLYLSLLLPFKFVGSLVTCFRLLVSIKPDLVISFGGYVAVPVGIVARLLGVRIITHEQTSRMGLSNRIMSSLAHTTAVSWPETQPMPNKAIITGNPVRCEFYTKQPRPNWLKLSRPFILVTGGSQGARSINHEVGHRLLQLLKRYSLVHVTGSSRNQQDFKELVDLRRQLPDELALRYQLKQTVTSSEMSYLMKHAELVICRSGANTCCELLMCQSKAVLVPLPIAAYNEQFHNAKILQKLMGSVVVARPQDAIDKILTNIEFPPPDSKLSDYKALHQNAASKLVSISLSSCES